MGGNSGGGGSGGRSGGGGDLVQKKYQQTVQVMENLKSGKLSRADVNAAISGLEKQENTIWSKYDKVASVKGKSVLSKSDENKLYALGNKKDVLQSALDFTRPGYTGPGPKHYLSQNMH